MTVTVDGETLTVEDVFAVAREDEAVAIDDDAREAVRAARERVADLLDSEDAVYGVNTGFGDLVTERIPREELDRLQVNLVRSHAAGVGRELAREEVRAMMLARLNTLVKGYSGVREVVVDHLTELLNEGIHPVVPSRGSLGASGDLAPLAHMALVLIGEGEADVQGDAGVERLRGGEALATARLDPLDLAPKEGLALINGTQLTAGLGALLVHDAERAVRAADIAGALTTEVTMGSTAACDRAISAVRPHEGQAASARNVKRLTAGSEIVESHRNCDRVQDAYSIRCLPQVHGAVRDATTHLREAVATELNSATDNPLLYPRERVDDYASGTADVAVLSGGNFHGAPLGHRLDYLAGALADLAAISERRTDRLLNPNVQEDHLPPFLAPESGLRSGYMLAQYAAAALVTEARARGRPGTDTIPVSGNQEDHVSMSAQSAFEARAALDDAVTVLAVELCCGTEASEYVDDDLSHGVGTGAAREAVREVVDPLTVDRSPAPDIERVDALLAGGLLDSRVREAVSNDLA
ncbi:histidine ammonia-lyase [Halorientalis pallida]|uniref:Histidine ammonia-lyase n=1 Tax=Halorientalis pallida TaxID=2479928 RepID=A0A498L5T3_9EURY|nr:histidine ammonia-lyase [Halorientalis pallida]RXK50045.1 histidine ammonia-lyase [Halorientalis pallida]